MKNWMALKHLNFRRFPVTVRLGAHNLTDPDDTFSIDVRAKRFTIHPQYDRENFHADIALIELQKSVTFNPFARPACLPSGKDTEHPAVGIATGWGKTRYPGGGISKVLREVKLPHVEHAECVMQMEKVRRSQLCYGGVEGKDTCSGDSGGPLQALSQRVYCSYTLYGITSYGDGCAASVPGVYTKVASYLNWIEGIVWPEEEEDED